MDRTNNDTGNVGCDRTGISMEYPHINVDRIFDRCDQNDR